jgi:hypothetical protein
MQRAVRRSTHASCPLWCWSGDCGPEPCVCARVSETLLRVFSAGVSAGLAKSPSGACSVDSTRDNPRPQKFGDTPPLSAIRAPPVSPRDRAHLAAQPIAARSSPIEDRSGQSFTSAATTVRKSPVRRFPRHAAVTQNGQARRTDASAVRLCDRSLHGEGMQPMRERGVRCGREMSELWRVPHRASPELRRRAAANAAVVFDCRTTAMGAGRCTTAMVARRRTTAMVARGRTASIVARWSPATVVSDRGTAVGGQPLWRTTQTTLRMAVVEALRQNRDLRARGFVHPRRRHGRPSLRRRALARVELHARMHRRRRDPVKVQVHLELDSCERSRSRLQGVRQGCVFAQLHAGAEPSVGHGSSQRM